MADQQVSTSAAPDQPAGVPLVQEEDIARPPSRFDVLFDRAFRGLTWGFAWLTVVLLVLIVLRIGWVAAPAIQKYGLDFLSTKAWDNRPDRQQFGVLPEIWGTLYSSILGVGLGAIFGVAVAIFLTQDFIPPRLEGVFKNIIELLAAIPSVVYGLWGIYVLVPALTPVMDWLHAHLGWIPIFGSPFQGAGLLPASLVLAIMVLPTITAISREALLAVPPKLKEAAFGLGATRWEAIMAVIVPTASRGIYGSIILGFGRALGETMALAMLVGSSNTISWSVLGTADTLAALMANKFNEARGPEVQALMYAALVLMAITLLVNIVGTLIVARASAGLKDLR